jgi:hypothetical protein
MEASTLVGEGVHCLPLASGLCTAVFAITELKPEALHALIKKVALLSDLGDAMGNMMDPPVDVRESLWKTKGWYKK